MLISNRSTLTTFYRHEKEDGTKVICHSSRGNDALVEANQALIDGDVVANNFITYMSWKPYDGGLELQHVVKIDPAGMIPDFIKNKAAARLASTLLIIVDYVQNGTVPEALF